MHSLQTICIFCIFFQKHHMQFGSMIFHNKPWWMVWSPTLKHWDEDAPPTQSLSVTFTLPPRDRSSPGNRTQSLNWKGDWITAGFSVLFSYFPVYVCVLFCDDVVYVCCRNTGRTERSSRDPGKWKFGIIKVFFPQHAS